MKDAAQGVAVRICPDVRDNELHALFKAAWKGHQPTEFGPVLERSLAYVCAFQGDELVGFVNLAWDGGTHAFLLDTTVHPKWRRLGIGARLVREAVGVAQSAGIVWVHVDFEAALRPFYTACGFAATEAGLLRLESER